MRRPIYRSISDIRKDVNKRINIKEGKYMCDVERVDIKMPFSFSASKSTLLEVIKAATSGPIVLAKELGSIAYIEIRNYG